MAEPVLPQRPSRKEQRVSLEERRLVLEEQRFAKESSFLAKNTGPVVITLIAGLFSITQILVANIQRASELHTTDIQKSKELELAAAERERRWQLDLSEFVFRHHDMIFSADDAERKYVRTVLLTTFPPETAGPFFSYVEGLASSKDQKETWHEGLRLVGTAKDLDAIMKVRTRFNALFKA